VTADSGRSATPSRPRNRRPSRSRPRPGGPAPKRFSAAGIGSRALATISIDSTSARPHRRARSLEGRAVAGLLGQRLSLDEAAVGIRDWSLLEVSTANTSAGVSMRPRGRGAGGPSSGFRARRPRERYRRRRGPRDWALRGGGDVESRFREDQPRVSYGVRRGLAGRDRIGRRSSRRRKDRRALPRPRRSRLPARPPTAGPRRGAQPVRGTGTTAWLGINGPAGGLGQAAWDLRKRIKPRAHMAAAGVTMAANPLAGSTLETRNRDRLAEGKSRSSRNVIPAWDEFVGGRARGDDDRCGLPDRRIDESAAWGSCHRLGLDRYEQGPFRRGTAPAFRTPDEDHPSCPARHVRPRGRRVGKFGPFELKNTPWARGRRREESSMEATSDRRAGRKARMFGAGATITANNYGRDENQATDDDRQKPASSSGVGHDAPRATLTIATKRGTG